VGGGGGDSFCGAVELVVVGVVLMEMKTVVVDDEAKRGRR